MTKPFIEVGDWVSFYRAVAPGSYFNTAIIARVLYITECEYVKGSLIYNTDLGPVGEKHILEVRKASQEVIGNIFEHKHLLEK